MGWKRCLAMATVALAFAFGFGTVATPQVAAQMPAEQPSMVTPDDVSLAESVRGTLAGDPDLSQNNIGVSAKDGVVKLVGTVRSEDDRQRAVRVAKNLPGVTEVDEDLRIIESDY
jgi:hyperosmotically inducible periplasmic protein